VGEPAEVGGPVSTAYHLALYILVMHGAAPVLHFIVAVGLTLNVMATNSAASKPSCAVLVPKVPIGAQESSR
jgi:hypothetical protein